jgi:hypothetical protein
MRHVVTHGRGINMLTQILLDHEPVADGGYLVRALLQLTGGAARFAR